MSEDGARKAATRGEEKQAAAMAMSAEAAEAEAAAQKGDDGEKSRAGEWRAWA
jgi:hypothetical protein